MTVASMPHIPSSTELGFMGSMSKARDGAGPGTNWGRNGDTQVVHAAPGEMMVPPEVLNQYPELAQIIGQALSNMGADPNRYVVGSPQSSINPHTGQPEFFFKSIKKALKKIASSTIGRIALTAVGAYFGAPYIGAAASGALASAATTKLSGGSWGQAIGSAAGSYLGSQVGLGGFGNSTVGSTLTKAGLSGFQTVLPNAIHTASLSTLGGAWLGSSIGEGIGAMVDPPKIKATAQSANDSQLMRINSTLPSTEQDVQLAIPGAADGAEIAKGAGINTNIPSGGINYLTQVKNRDTGQMNTINAAFSGNFGNSRRSSWGGGVAFV